MLYTALEKKEQPILFYKLMKVMKVNIIYNHADYRLCSKRVLTSLSEFGEVNLFLRGIILFWNYWGNLLGSKTKLKVSY